LSAGIPPSEKLIAPPPTANLKAAGWILAVDLTATAKNLETTIHALERVTSDGHGHAAELIPIRFVYTNKITKDDKLLLAFDTLVLSEKLGRKVSLSKIIHGDNQASLKVKVASSLVSVQKTAAKIETLLTSSKPPDVILNRHCAECEFRDRCRKEAIEKDDLSLLSGMTVKQRRKYNGKGIFTVTQLSYTFRPRRRSKRKRDKHEKYHHSLKALAIREKKIHIVGTPELKIEGTPVYLDVEGLPDRDFYYLIGVRIGNGESAVQHSLWADNPKDERNIWNKFCGILKAVDKPVLIHYGRYETTFLKVMAERYGSPKLDSLSEKAMRSPVNLVSLIFARIYFPTFSNSLKEIAGWLGFKWSVTGSTGLNTIAWREIWATLGSSTEQPRLMKYNAEDCAALELLTQTVIGLCPRQSVPGTSSESTVVDVASLKREHPHGFKRNAFAIPELDAINKAAYWDYQRERVYVRSNRGIRRAIKRSCQHRHTLRPNRIVQCPRPLHCPHCSSTVFIKKVKATKLVFDLKFTLGGIKRWITRYEFYRYKCSDCTGTFYPQDRDWTGSIYGSSLLNYSVYQTIELYIPACKVSQSLNKFFGLQLAASTAELFKKNAAKIYTNTYQTLLDKLKGGSMIHADETKISLRSGVGFVWVFANMEEVAYVYAETREADMVHAFLKDFKGVLVSDFFAAYDGIECPQQKCLIHLIRDLNDDLLQNPYADDLKQIARTFTELLKPMVETVDQFGLKSRFLKKHLPSVDRFYRGLSRMELSTDVALYYKERFEKYRNKLFTFLSFDGVPWNNNNAEHSVKSFAMLRHVINGITTEKSFRDYLILLSICQTCKYQGLEFLDFLRSGETDIDTFAQKQTRTRKPIMCQPF
jgi:predicted RecB family nuclease